MAQVTGTDRNDRIIPGDKSADVVGEPMDDDDEVFGDLATTVIRDNRRAGTTSGARMTRTC